MQTTQRFHHLPTRVNTQTFASWRLWIYCTPSNGDDQVKLQQQQWLNKPESDSTIRRSKRAWSVCLSVCHCRHLYHLNKLYGGMEAFNLVWEEIYSILTSEIPFKWQHFEFSLRLAVHPPTRRNYEDSPPPRRPCKDNECSSLDVHTWAQKRTTALDQPNLVNVFLFCGWPNGSSSKWSCGEEKSR